MLPFNVQHADISTGATHNTEMGSIGTVLLHLILHHVSLAEAWWERGLLLPQSYTASNMTTRLPVEILTAIVEEVDEIRHLWQVRTASRTLCAVATPIAFRVLSVITTRESARNLGRLFDIPDIAAHVREVAYHDTGADRKGRPLKYGVSPTPRPINDITTCLYAPTVTDYGSQN